MTANRDLYRDRSTTLELLDRINRTADIPVLPISWLDHAGGNGQLDFELLWGTTLASMEKHCVAVQEHLLHLAKEHGLKVKVHDGIYRLAVPPPGH